jgi:hypothetical protein
LPGLAQPSLYANFTALTSATLTRALRAVFIVEDDENQLLRNLRSRGRGFESWGRAEQKGFARASWQLGQWFTHEAQALGIPVIASQPFTTLSARILRAIA